MRKVLIGLFILVFVLAAVVFIGPSLVDWNDYKGQIAEAVERQTGRELSIDGDISLSLLPAPALSVKGVRFANIEGAENPDMASLRSLDVLVAFAPLLEGRIQVQSLELVEPTIRLEVLPDGRTNWSFTPAEETGESAGGDGGEGGFGSDVRFDRIAISDGTVIYRDHTTGREERIEDLDARITATSLDGPFSIEGDASYRGIGLGFDGGTGRLAPQGQMPFNLAVILEETEGELRFNGTVDQSTSPASVNGTLVAKGQNPHEFAAALGAPGALPEAVAGPFQVETAVAYGEDKLTLGSLSIVLADLRAEGQASVALGGEVPEAALQLDVSQVNLDALLDGGDEEAESGESGGGSDPVAAFALPQGIDARLDLTVQTMIYRAQVVRDAVVRGRLLGGVLQLEEASALLPGGSRFALDGQVTQVEAGSRFEGSLEAESDNLRTLLEWAEVDLGSISAERLRRLSLTTQIVATPKQLDLTGIDATLDVSTITGGLAVALGRRPSFGAGITVDKINLDAYLGGDGLGADGGESDGEGEASNPLAGFDANLDLRAGQVVYQGQTAYDLHLDATVQNGGMTIREARVGNLANSRATLSGRLEGLPDAPALSDGSFDVEVNDPAAVSRVLGMGGDGPLAALGPFSARGDVSGGLNAFTLDGSIDAAPISGSLAGSFSGLPLEPQVENGRFDLDVKNPAALAALAGMQDSDGTLARLGAVTLKGTASGGPQQLTLDATAGIKGGTIGLSGTAANLLGGPSFDLALDVDHPDLAALLAVFAPDQPIPDDVGGIDLQAQLEGSPERMSATGIQGRVGPTDLSGEAIYDQGAERPLVTANLVAGELPLAAFGLAGAGGEGDGGSGPAPNDGERWSSEPIDTGPLRRFDADIDLKADAIVHQDWRLENATLLAKLREGVLTVERLDGDLFGGRVAVNGTVTAGEDIAADLKLDAEQVDTARLVGVLGGIDRVSGPLSFSADLTTRGVSQRELVNNLNGTGLIDGNLQAKASSEEKGLAVLLGFLGSQVPQVQGVTEAAFLILNAFAGEAAKLSGTLNIENGVIRTDDGRLEGQGAFALLRGMAADLPDWQIDFATELFRSEDVENAFVTLGLIGPLDDPNTKLGGLAMTPGGQGGLQGMIQNLTGQAAGQQGEGATQQEALQGVIQGITGQAQQGGQQQAEEGEQEAAPQGGGEGGLQGLLQGLAGGALGTQLGQQQQQPADTPDEAPEPGAEPGPEGDEVKPLTEVIEGEPGEQTEAAPAPQAEEPQQEAPQAEEAQQEEPQPQENQVISGGTGPEAETLDGIALPTPRPAAIESGPAPEELTAPAAAAEESQPAPEETVQEQPAQEETVQEPQPAQDEQQQAPSGNDQLRQLLEGIGVRQPEQEQQAPSDDGGWQDPQAEPQQQDGTQSGTQDSTGTRQPEAEQQNQNSQPGANFIRNLLKGGKKE